MVCSIISNLTAQKERLEKEVKGLTSKNSQSYSTVGSSAAKHKMLMNISGRAKIYERDCRTLQGRLVLLNSSPNIQDVEENIKQQELTLKALEKTNWELNKRFTHPRRNTVAKRHSRCDFKEYSNLGQQVDLLEKKIGKCKTQITELDEKTEGLKKEYSLLKEEASQYEDYTEQNKLHERHEDLNRKKRILSSALSSTTEKLKHQIKRLQHESKELDQRTLKLNMQLLKKKQQSRLFSIKQDEMRYHSAASPKKSGNEWTPSVEFLYNPSIKKIYYT